MGEAPGSKWGYAARERKEVGLLGSFSGPSTTRLNADTTPSTHRPVKILAK